MKNNFAKTKSQEINWHRNKESRLGLFLSLLLHRSDSKRVVITFLVIVFLLPVFNTPEPLAPNATSTAPTTEKVQPDMKRLKEEASQPVPTRTLLGNNSQVNPKNNTNSSIDLLMNNTRIPPFNNTNSTSNHFH